MKYLMSYWLMMIKKIDELVKQGAIGINKDE